MSSQEEDYNDADGAAQGAKKRRIQPNAAAQFDVSLVPRAIARIYAGSEGDGGQMPKNRCSNCVSYNYECTYVEAAKKRGPPKGYVESLETRLEKMERLLNKLCPNADFSKELGGHFDRNTWHAERSANERSSMGKAAYKLPSTSGMAAPSALVPANPPVDSEDLDPSDDEVVAQHTIVQNFRKMKPHPNSMRFFGKSSSLMFLQTAMDLKHEYTGVELPKSVDPRTHSILSRGRQNYWSLHPWLTATIQNDLPPHRDFPPPDLLDLLIDFYFVNMNDYVPLLHRPTFEKGIKDGLHLRDEGFGSVVLLVCANGSRFTDDPRVLLEGFLSTHSNGWKWFQQVQMVRKSLLAPPRLYDLQIHCLTATFLQGTSAPQACWTIIGVGIRMAQDVGAHRRKVYNTVPTVEEELWKRAFWSLVLMDRSTSCALGRPCAIQDEDFDLDLPLECDDEYWENPDPSLAFKQPPGKPSKVTYFNCGLRLNQILAFALRTIYSINKSKALLGFVGQQWEQHIVAELDSALNKWVDSVPDHLRWDPNRENILFLNQSAHLYASYYQLQISVHRPFIPSPRKPSPLSFPSLAICTNAARSCTHVLDIQYKRSAPLFHNQMALFTAGIVLLLNIWGGKRSGLTTDPAKEMADVHKCMKILKALDSHWHTAGRLRDILYELASVGDLPLPQSSPAASNKRDRDSDSPISTPATASTAPPSSAPTPASTANLVPPADNVPRSIAGSRRVSTSATASSAPSPYAQPPQLQPPPPPPPQPQPRVFLHSPNIPPNATSCLARDNTFSLPIHSDELGHICAPRGAAGRAFYGRQPAAGPEYPVGSIDDSLDVLHAALCLRRGLLDYADAPTRPAGIPADAPALQTMQDANIGPPFPAGAGEDMSSFTDNTLAMWSAAPTGFEWDDWGTYITNVSGMNNTQTPGS
ncbi:hypothetical protein A0H81_13860 [Grifola frondosa]|uniref:Xylanolytic transcriptional activator regulatory domain-containing protein n=1 Tax=Grifola frondosa TaxID=5627 RepID=A0A1C7LNT1_GRIFR|nr:hypothetical protein A0H81_13860 [Grifola frondosa]